MSDEGSNRAGFWPRAWALLIDGCLVTLVLGLAGLFLYTPTAGRIRVGSTLLSSQECWDLSPEALQNLPTQIRNMRAPPDFQPTNAVRCTTSLLGHPHDNVVIVSQVTRFGSGTYTRSLEFPIDTEGAPLRAFYLDRLWVLLFAVYVVGSEWRYGRTLGKDLMNMRVQSLTGEPASFIQAAKRFFVRFLPLVLADSLSFTGGFIVPLLASSGFPWVLWLLFLSPFLAIQANFIIAVRRQSLPWHDRFAATEVVVGR